VAKISQARWSRKLLEICPKKLPHFEEESYESAKIFGAFGWISFFFFF